jgi:RHS repeat-associated protein
MATNQPSDPAAQATLVATTYAYDPAGHLTSIDTGSDATLVRFGIDALGRHASQSIGPVGTETAVTTYAYLGTADTVSSSRKIEDRDPDPDEVTLTYSAIDAIGNRLTTGTSEGIAYLLPDLHGNVVATMTGGSTPAFSAAYRYDAYGVTCDSYAPSGSIASPWRYQGRILESADGTADLYDFSARSYDPSLGAFTSFDSVTGSAQNPLTLNRYLYANANPATLVDPDGHCSWNPFDGDSCMSQPVKFAWEAGNNIVNLGNGFRDNMPNAVLHFGRQTFGGAQALFGAGVDGLKCAADTSCGIHNIQEGWSTFSKDPGGSIQSAWNQGVDKAKLFARDLALAGADLAQKFEDCKAANDYYKCGQEAAEVFTQIEGNGLMLIYGAKAVKGLPGAVKGIPAAVRNLPTLIKGLGPAIKQVITQLGTPKGLLYGIVDTIKHNEFLRAWVARVSPQYAPPAWRAVLQLTNNKIFRLASGGRLFPWHLHLYPWSRWWVPFLFPHVADPASHSAGPRKE